MKKIVILLIYLSLIVDASDSLQKVSLQLHWKYQFEFAGFIAAKEKGFYKDVGLDVTLKEYSFGLNIEDEIIKGNSNYGIYSSSILLSYLQGKPLKLISSFFKRSAMVLVTTPDIKYPKDLIGKTIMADTQKDFNLKFKYMFDTQGIDTTQLTLIKHTYNLQDFADGKVDAIAAFISDQPYKLSKLNIKYNILNPSDYGMYNLLLELFTSEQEAIEFPQRTENFKNASIKGWQYALTHKEEMIDIIRTKYTQHFSKDILENEAMEIQKLIIPYAYEIGSIDKNFLNKQLEIFKKNYHIKNNKGLDDFIFGSKTQKIDWVLFIEIFSIILIIFLFILWNNYKLKTAVKNKTETLQNVLDSMEITIKSRTKELNDEKNFVNTVLNSQENFVITSDGKHLRTANKAFYQFFEVKTREEFLEKFGSCICETFDTTAPKGYIQKMMGNKEWLTFINNRPNQIHKTIIKKDGKDYIFTITSEKLFVKNEELKTAIFTDVTQMEEITKQMQETHKHTRDSIEYASLIQGALIPQKGVMEPFFKEHFVTWKPKDTVGGDIWLFEDLRHQDESILMYIDCTGHGVAGAFVTMIVKAVEREIISIIKSDPTMEVSPSWILGYFNKTIKRLLRQENNDSVSNAGFDGGVVYYNRRTQIIKFAGAETPLFYIDKDNNLQMIKGDRYSVGYKKCAINYTYKETVIPVHEGMKFFCTTDGYLDQNGGKKDFPFGKKRFLHIIEENKDKSMAEFQTIFQYKMREYESIIKNNERNDDMTIIGFTIGATSDYREKLVKEIIKYDGVITQNVIATCMDNIESKITNLGAIGHISTITIEYCQNMLNYSKSDEINSKEIVPAGTIEVQCINHNYYEIVATNIVSLEDKLKIEPKLTEIQSFDKVALKKRYRELRKSGQNKHQNGGGIGLYEIAKASDSIEYNFLSINEDKYYFTMKSFISVS